MEFKELMATFGKRCGLDDLAVDENGVVTMQADDIVLSFAEVSATRQLLMQAEVADKPATDGAPLYERLLAAQYMGGVLGGACFSLSPQGKIALHRMDALLDLDAERLAGVVEAFLNLVDMWREILEAYRFGAPAETGDEKAAPPPNLGLGGGFGYLSV